LQRLEIDAAETQPLALSVGCICYKLFLCYRGSKTAGISWIFCRTREMMFVLAACCCRHRYLCGCRACGCHSAY